MSKKKKVVIGFLGTQLDIGSGPGRFGKWRPSVALAMYEDFQPDRIELLVDEQRYANLAKVVQQDIVSQAPGTAVRLQHFQVDDPWDFQLMYASLFDFVRNYPFDIEREEYLVNITTGTHVAQICWFLLTEAHFLPARLLQLSPPKKQQVGNAGTYRIIDLDLARYDAIAQRFATARADNALVLKSGIATKNPAFNRMITQIEHIAGRSRAPILLMGPTGAGKSMLAKNLYQLKRHQQALQGKFVEVNCATLRGDTAASALFGHAKGAFTGAANARAGHLKSADGGLLFLDEIAELGLDEQAMLLKAIEDKRFQPMGSDEEISSDFQLIAGTNEDLAIAVRKGEFRDDLFARLNLWTFTLPSLRERVEDIAPNLDFELQRYALQNHQNVGFNREARALYLQFASSAMATWAGNFRDLSASVTRMATLSEDGRITQAVVREEFDRLRALWRAGEPSDPASQPPLCLTSVQWSALDRFDRAQLLDVISVCQSAKSLSDAGRVLFQASRAKKASSNDADRLKKYLARFDLSFDQVQRRDREAL
jgi:transcriptional regulatory protein RtcR